MASDEMTTDITSWLRVYSDYITEHDVVVALASRAADGPLVEDVECPTCGDTGHALHRDADEFVRPTLVDCPSCHGTGTVRIVVHRDHRHGEQYRWRTVNGA